jgi:superoxide reductase
VTKLKQVYKCDVCGNIIEVVHAAPGELVCCGKPMQLITENTVDAAKEKHVPIMEKVDGGYKVTVGSVNHPMEEKHYIEWIEILADDILYRKWLQPGDMPEATFLTDADNVIVRSYCNLHGLWKNDKA